MDISGTGGGSAAIRQYNAAKDGGAQAQPTTKGGNTSNPVEIVSVSAGTAVRQPSAPTPDVADSNQGGALSSGLSTTPAGIAATEEGKGARMDLAA